MKTSNLLIIISALSVGMLTSGCTSVVIDQYRTGDVDREDTDTVVVLGRRYAANYDTEIDLISCVGDELHDSKNLRVIPEQQFIDSLYP